jgi:23S rRNA (adenine2030-N6)-methyltransferase
MFGYRHAFHAGNFADVFKHAVLIQLLRALLKKDKPFFVLDTHAGAGGYDLRSPEAQKVGEYQGGIAKIWDRSGLSAELQDYRDLVAGINRSDKLVYYPGSPTITHTLLREHDRLVLCEAHPSEFPALQATMRGARGVSVIGTDGYEALKTYVPPKENRGLVFMDPSFEMDGEFERARAAVRLVHQRWSNGMLAIWYPILSRAPSARFQQTLQRMSIPNVLCVELGLAPYDTPRGMHGCGLILVNPPWQLDKMLARVLPELLEILRTGPRGETRVEWLAPPAG